MEASGKMAVLDRMLAMLFQRGHRVTLFSQFNIMLDIIEDYLIMRGYKWVFPSFGSSEPVLASYYLALGESCSGLRKSGFSLLLFLMSQSICIPKGRH